MPPVQTRYFGELDYQAESVLEFPLGLPGFESQTRFLLIEQPLNHPLVFLQSLARAELCFVALPVQIIEPNYCLNLGPEDLEVLELAGGPQPAIGGEVLCLAFLSLAGEHAPTANLLSPIVVNLENRKAVQAIQMDTPYSHLHSLFSEVEEPACS